MERGKEAAEEESIEEETGKREDAEAEKADLVEKMAKEYAENMSKLYHYYYLNTCFT